MSSTNQRPAWALRECSSCRQYAVALCQAWDSDRGAACAAPVCAWHRHGLQLPLCPTHGKTAGRPASKPKQAAQQGGLFDSGNFR